MYSMETPSAKITDLNIGLVTVMEVMGYFP